VLGSKLAAHGSPAPRGVLRVIALDWLTIAASTGVALFTLLVCVLKNSVPDVVTNLERSWADTQRSEQALVRLGVALDPKLGLVAPAPPQGELLQKLDGAGELARAVNAAKPATDAAWAQQLKGLCDEERKFLTEHTGDLCEGTATPLEVPKCEVADAIPVAWIEVLRRLGNYRAELFKKVTACGQESRITVGESSLHFVFDSDTEFQMTPDETKRGIDDVLAEVDTAVFREKQRKIFVFGHSDSRGACNDAGRDNHNYRLSFGRAWFLTQAIRDHLASKGLMQGKDYLLTVAGHGDSRPKPCKGDECRSADYDTANRRIEIAFQHLSAKDLAMMNAFPTKEALGPTRADCAAPFAGGQTP